jgi:hypothetical protein
MRCFFAVISPYWYGRKDLKILSFGPLFTDLWQDLAHLAPEDKALIFIPHHLLL